MGSSLRYRVLHRVAGLTDRSAGLRRGQVVLGFGPAANLSDHHSGGPGPAWAGRGGAKGAGVEIMPELDGVRGRACPARALPLTDSRHRAAEATAVGPARFVLFDSDGYYVRVAHADCEAAEPP